MSARVTEDGLLSEYDPNGYFCELFGRRGLAHTRRIRQHLNEFDIAGLRRRARDAERDAVDRILPFDVIPRVLSQADWAKIESGVKQRVTAINLFLRDIYNEAHILKDGVVPVDLVKENANFREEMCGFTPPQGTYVHICGIDIVRDEKGVFRVLEDNARTPSGVSYVIENRHLMMRAFPDLAEGVPIADIDDYGRQLARALSDVGPAGVSAPTVALLSPGIYNSAYFEHVFLAREMGAPLVEGQDLVVENDKAVYAYMPRIIRYYLAEDPILQNVETNICREADGLKRTLARLDELVTKPVGASGGHGVVIGPRASKKALSSLRSQLKKDPDNFISQPMINLSVCPILVGRAVEPRHVDLRPFALTGKDSWVLPGGLTRVALKRGSLVVNSSQGGGTKDTWVLA